MSISNIIAKMLMIRPDVKNNPQAMEALTAIENGDAEKGQAIARAICQQRGVDPQTASNEASNWFNNITSGRS